MIELGHIKNPEQLTSFLMQLYVCRGSDKRLHGSDYRIAAINGLNSDRMNFSWNWTSTMFGPGGNYEAQQSQLQHSFSFAYIYPDLIDTQEHEVTMYVCSN